MSRRVEADTGRKVYVGNLDPGATSDELEGLFGKHGNVAAVWVARNPPGFAFVTFDDPRDAQDAVNVLDGATLNGKHLRVEVARGPRNPNRIPPEWRRERERERPYGRPFSGIESPRRRRSPSYGRYDRCDSPRGSPRGSIGRSRSRSYSRDRANERMSTIDRRCMGRPDRRYDRPISRSPSATRTGRTNRSYS